MYETYLYPYLSPLLEGILDLLPAIPRVSEKEKEKKEQREFEVY